MKSKPSSNEEGNVSFSYQMSSTKNLLPQKAYNCSLPLSKSNSAVSIWQGINITDYTLVSQSKSDNANQD